MTISMNNKPVRIDIKAGNIPKELTVKNQWLVWKWAWDEKAKKWTKPPYDPRSGSLASSTNPSTWVDFSTAYHAVLYGDWDGIGFVLRDGYCGIDFDNSRDTATGNIKESARPEILALNSYTEVSPSGEGFKTLCRAKLPKGGHHKNGVGVFCEGRYFCITGHTIEGVSGGIEERQSEVEAIVRRRYPQDFEDNPVKPSSTPITSTPLSDLDLIQRAKQAGNKEKFCRLWDGDANEYTSRSEADFALCAMLSFWTGKDKERIDRLFRQSGLMREKWDQKHFADGRTYGQSTIEKAIQGTTETYGQSKERNIFSEGYTPPQPKTTTDKEKKSGIELKLTTISEVYEYPDLTYLIEDTIPEETVNVIGGYTGVGKSMVVLDLIKSVATGKPFLGEYGVSKSGPVLIVDEETPRPLLRDRIRKMKFDPSWPVYFLHFQDIKIDKESIYTALIEKIKEVKPILVVFDSLIRIHRKREKESEEMAQVIDALRKIANWGTTVIVIHHHKKGGGPLTEKLRGSSDIPGGIDIEFALTPEKEGSDILLFQSVKTRIKPSLPIRIKLNITEDTAAVECCGTVNETILDVVVSILSGENDFLTIKQITERLIKEKFDDFKEYEIRKALKEGERLGILKSGETKIGKSKATTYKVDDDSRTI